MGKIVLGTVQFGLQYGVNSEGRPTEEGVREILRQARLGGIDTMDTSGAYGNSEEILGRSGTRDFRVVSKYPMGKVPVEEMFRRSLELLKLDSLYGYLLHHFQVYRDNPAVWDSFMALKESGKVSKIGFSLYEPSELELLLERDVPFDLLQIPFNVLDRKFGPYLKELHAKGVEIHVRSTFLQGLFFMDREKLPEKLKPLGKYLQELDDYARENGISMAQLALNANLQNPFIDGVLIGVDNPAQLRANLQAVSDVKIDVWPEVEEKELLNPVNWK